MLEATAYQTREVLDAMGKDSGVWLGVTGLLFVLLNVTTGGEFFLHAVIYKRQPWE